MDDLRPWLRRARRDDSISLLICVFWSTDESGAFWAFGLPFSRLREEIGSVLFSCRAPPAVFPSFSLLRLPPGLSLPSCLRSEGELCSARRSAATSREHHPFFPSSSSFSIAAWWSDDDGAAGIGEERGGEHRRFSLDLGNVSISIYSPRAPAISMDEIRGYLSTIGSKSYQHMLCINRGAVE